MARSYDQPSVIERGPTFFSTSVCSRSPMGFTTFLLTSTPPSSNICTRSIGSSLTFSSSHIPSICSLEYRNASFGSATPFASVYGKYELSVGKFGERGVCVTRE